MRKEIYVAGVGWMLSGVVSIATWAVAFSKIFCNCLSVPTNVSHLQAYVVCNCINPVGLIFVGIFVMAVGAGILVNNKKIDKMLTERRLTRKTKTIV